ncbi:hypothetical protein AVEN_96944-1 [Araneus ventricosus]|uniref:Uncharacterized protein n=1 Tax=Araneus ventricosus TaxID=182803 RepID=A0A4Y2MJ05_ARAVE|nr:hypothetical protein AVEN_96944-1 [Araneus ventricosus]
MDMMDTEEETSGSSTAEICANNDDTEFCSFYYKAIKRLLDIDNRTNVSLLHRYVKIFSEYYEFWCQVKQNLKDCDNTIINLLKDSLYYRFVYVYRHATLLSSAVAFHFRNVYKQSPKNIERLITKKKVKICSFGGCSASDIVAIVTVLESIALKNGIDLDFRVTIIESDERWKITCITILSCLQQFHKATWKITFIQGNLKKNSWTPETIKVIQEADVVTIVRLLSKFKHKKKIMKEICGKLQPRAVLFCLDRPLTRLIEISFGINDSDDFELIHIESCDLHTLDIEAVNHFKNLYQKHFGNQKHFEVNTSFNVFISVWIKTSPELSVKCQDNKECILEKNVENTIRSRTF